MTSAVIHQYIWK